MARDFHSNNLPKYKPLERAYRFPKPKYIYHARVKNSHVGIGKLTFLKSLFSASVNQEYLEEICELKNLTRLSISCSTATDFSGLKNLKKLKYLQIRYSHRSSDFSFVRELPSLEGLYFEHLKQLTDYNIFHGLNTIKRLGIEGTTSGTLQKIESLRPFATMEGLEELYLTSVRLKDKNLTYLVECESLKILQCARFAPKKNFMELASLRPDILCRWIENYELN